MKGTIVSKHKTAEDASKAWWKIGRKLYHIVNHGDFAEFERVVGGNKMEQLTMKKISDNEYHVVKTVIKRLRDNCWINQE